MNINKFIKGFHKQIAKNGFTYRPFADECCFFFASMLKGAFPESTIVIESIKNHFMIYYQGKYYDMEGKVEDVDEQYIWVFDDLKVIDPAWHQRILRDVVYKTTYE